jgi:hypothetical protein
MNKLRVSILYIATGKYSVFWEQFYNTSQKNFLPNAHKHYFVFTDDNSIKNEDNVTIIKKQCEGYPLDTLMRFEMFMKVKEEALKSDYSFYFNANMAVVELVGDEIFPYKGYKGLIGVEHPLGYKYRRFPSMYTYERNKKSTAYISKERKNYSYFMGGLNGGSSEAYFKMVEKLDENIKKDLANDIIAEFHDESHLNKYLNSSKAVHKLPTSYGYPEGVDLPLKPLIVVLDKTKFSKEFNHYRGESKFGRIKRYFKQIFKALTW